MAVALTIFWSFATLKYPAADNGGMNHFQFFMSPRGAPVDGSDMDQFLVFLSP